MTYKWVALSNTTLGVLMSALDGSIVIIALPAIFRGIGLDPLAPGNIGFVVFGAASVALSFDPFHAAGGAERLIGRRVVQAVGGSVLTANSAAILTDAFPAEQRGMALGVNRITALAGQFLGLVAGGLLAELDWRAVFWVSVPFGLLGTIRSIRSLREVRTPRRAKVDWGGNVTFAAGTALVLAGITYGIQPPGGAATGWGNPWVLGGIGAGVLLLLLFGVIETRVAAPMFQLSLFKIRAFAALLIIWLPLHGYGYERTPLWAGIHLLPLTVGFLVAGPVSGYLSDRFGARPLATGGLLLAAAAFLGLLALPVDFPYPAFAALLVVSGIGQGMFAAPNTSAIMSSVPTEQRGVASGMRACRRRSPAVCRPTASRRASPTASRSSRRSARCSPRSSAARSGTCSARTSSRRWRRPTGRRSPAASSSRGWSPARSTTAWWSCSPRPRRWPSSPRSRPLRAAHGTSTPPEGAKEHR